MLTPQESTAAEQFLSRLSLEDRANVSLVQAAVQRVADDFFQSPDFNWDRHLSLFSRCLLKEVFYTVYGIGSCVA